MGFFDDLSNKVAQTSQGVIEKTRKTADSMKLKNMIAEEERNLDSCLKQIGTLYYNTHKDDTDTEYAQLIEAIKHAKLNIETYSEQIKQLKGIVPCPNCGADVPYGAMFCNSCGSSMSAVAVSSTASPSTVYCNKCGAEMQSGKKFCSRCGNRVDDIDTIQENAIQRSQANMANSVICPQCGASLPKGKKFCTKCGNKIEIIEEQQEPEKTVNSQTDDFYDNDDDLGKIPDKEEKATDENIKICSTCGKELSINATFCTECGTKLEEEN